MITMSNSRQLKPSFEKVNYLLRPRKQIERKIIIELLRLIQDIDKYNYIGLGSIFYYDFILFHKLLNINKMISLDDKTANKRFKFNLPYDFIKFINKRTTDFFSIYKLKSKTIIWLDYDIPIFKNHDRNNTIFRDIDLVCRNLKSPIILILTIDVKNIADFNEIKAFFDEFNCYIPDKLKTDIIKRIPREFNLHYDKIVQNIILNYFDEIQKLDTNKFSKLFSFCYEDSRPMFTLGGVLGVKNDADDIIKLVKTNEFYNTDYDNITSIDVPNLTYKEKIYIDENISFLNGCLEKAKKNKRKQNKVLNDLGFELSSIDSLRAYLRFCRYYPQYYEGII